MALRIAIGVIAGLIAGLAVGFFPAMETWWWLTHHPRWPVGESLTLPLVWTPWVVAGGAVGAACGWHDHTKSSRKTSRE